jgi:uncharacterized protein YbjT (DUF2867 family)
MRIFLTGATGYVGSAVLDGLLRASHDVTALVRDNEKAARVAVRRTAMSTPRSTPRRDAARRSIESPST